MRRLRAFLDSAAVLTVALAACSNETQPEDRDGLLTGTQVAATEAQGPLASTDYGRIPGAILTFNGLGYGDETWITSARSGKPNASPIPEWPAYNLEQRLVMVFDEAPEVVVTSAAVGAGHSTTAPRMAIEMNVSVATT